MQMLRQFAEVVDVHHLATEFDAVRQSELGRRISIKVISGDEENPAMSVCGR